MLPFTPGVTQQFHALPTCVEDQNIDILADIDFQDDNVGDIKVQQQVEELLCTASPDWQEFLLKIPDTQYRPNCVAPGLVFEVASTDQRQRNSSSPVIPLSVQQAQLDNIDTQTISQSEWISEDVLQLRLLSSDDRGAPTTSLGQLPAERQTSPDTTDQTVPFRRHDSVCSTLSSFGDVKRERVSVSDAEPLTPSTLFRPTARPSTSQAFSHGGRRGRPSYSDVSASDILLTPSAYVPYGRTLIGVGAMGLIYPTFICFSPEFFVLALPEFSPRFCRNWGGQLSLALDS